MSELFIPIAYSAIAGSATLIGLALVLYAEKWVKKHSYYVVSLAAGVLLGTAFFHLLPEASELQEESFLLWTVIGFAAFYLIEVLVGFHACRENEEDHDHDHVLGPVASLGILVHSILDGITIAIGFEIDPSIGIITAIAVMVHELPEGIFTISILLHSHMNKKKAILWTFAVALATPLGTLATLVLFPNLGVETLGTLLAIAAGSFIYVSASDLIPESHKSRSISTGIFMIIGLVLMYFVFGGH
ncbi:MAG: zinc and cadmium transporter [Oceanicoccus sp.]|jgi:zinc and cadmium transporter